MLNILEDKIIHLKPGKTKYISARFHLIRYTPPHEIQNSEDRLSYPSVPTATGPYLLAKPVSLSHTTRAELRTDSRLEDHRNRVNHQYRNRTSCVP